MVISKLQSPIHLKHRASETASSSYYKSLALLPNYESLVTNN